MKTCLNVLQEKCNDEIWKIKNPVAFNGPGFFNAIGYYDFGAVFVSAEASPFFLQHDFSPFVQPSFFSPAQALEELLLQHSFLFLPLSLSSPKVFAMAVLPNKPANAATNNIFFIF